MTTPHMTPAPGRIADAVGEMLLHQEGDILALLDALDTDPSVTTDVLTKLRDDALYAVTKGGTEIPDVPGFRRDALKFVLSVNVLINKKALEQLADMGAFEFREK